jgi:glycosyltransferase involved in cell wall biosynthesis
MESPLVSIIALNYNQSEFLVESLNAIANQSYRNFEIIITDDLSADDSREKIDDWVKQHQDLKIIKVYNDSNLGLCKTLNKAIALSSGEYIKPIACDDILFRDYLEGVLGLFNDKIHLVFTDMMLINKSGEIKQESNYKYNKIDPKHFIQSKESILESQYLSAPTLIYRKSLFENIGGYDESLAYEDWDFLLKASKWTDFGFLNKSLVKYRMHELNMHKSLKNNERFVDSTLRILFREAQTSENIRIKENLAKEICKMLIINESKGIEYLNVFQKRYSRNKVSDPLVSILITSYQTEEFILSCIRTQLLQTYSNIEIVLVDDGSKDQTIKLAKSIEDDRIRIFSLEHQGRVPALNYGLSECKGEYIALMDSDDMASPLRIEQQVDYCMEQQLDAVSSQLFQFEQGIHSEYIISSFSKDEKEIKVKMLFYNPVPHAATLFRTAAIRNTGYREGFDYAEDYEMLARFCSKYKLGLLNKPLYIYRRRSASSTGVQNTSKSISSQKKIQQEIFKRHLFDITQEELNLHSDIEKQINNPQIDKKALISIRKFLHRIISANKRSDSFDKKVLKTMLLHNYWSIYYYHNKHLHGLLLGLNLMPFQNLKMNLITLAESIKADIRRLIISN